MWPGDSLHLKKALVIPRSKAVSSSVSSQPTSDSGNEIHNIPRSASGMFPHSFCSVNNVIIFFFLLQVPDTRQSRVTATYDVQNLFSKMDANVSNIESSMEAHPPSDVYVCPFIVRKLSPRPVSQDKTEYTPNHPQAQIPDPFMVIK